MPFLTKKTAGMRVTSLLAKEVKVGNGVAWQEDEYRPSNQVARLGGLGLSPSLEEVQQRRFCGSTGCSSGWTMPWRSRRRPIFEGQWGCSGRCVLAMVQTAVSRELGEAGESAISPPHRHRIPLGLMMLAQGWITQSQLQKALTAQRERGSGRIGEWLKTECGLAPEQIMRGVSMQWGCPVLTTEGFSPESMALVMPKIFVEKLGVLPLRTAGSRILYLGFSEQLDASAAFATEQMTKLKVESGVVDAAQFETARGRLLECDGVDLKLETVEDKDVMAAKITAILEQKRPIGSRLVRLHDNYWLRMWLESGTIGRSGSLPTTREDVMDHVFYIGSNNL
jgi:Type II secretion system (T2SS), protein E, N-terminal domain